MKNGWCVICLNQAELNVPNSKWTITQYQIRTIQVKIVVIAYEFQVLKWKVKKHF